MVFSLCVDSPPHSHPFPIYVEKPETLPALHGDAAGAIEIDPQAVRGEIGPVTAVDVAVEDGAAPDGAAGAQEVVGVAQAVLFAVGASVGEARGVVGHDEDPAIGEAGVGEDPSQRFELFGRDVPVGAPGQGVGFGAVDADDGDLVEEAHERPDSVDAVLGPVAVHVATEVAKESVAVDYVFGVNVVIARQGDEALGRLRERGDELGGVFELGFETQCGVIAGAEHQIHGMGLFETDERIDFFVGIVKIVPTPSHQIQGADGPFAEPFAQRDAAQGEVEMGIAAVEDSHGVFSLSIGQVSGRTSRSVPGRIRKRKENAS